MSTLYDEKVKTLALIEELNPDSEYLTDDPDIAAKINSVFNQVMFELARLKKIPKYVEIEVSEGDTLTYDDFERVSGYVTYQVERICGVDFVAKASNTVYKIMSDGVAEVDLFVYPEAITDKTKDKAYEFELSPDVLEIMPYGVAADLLKSDVSAEYGSVYATRYEQMLQRLDPRYQTSMIQISGGVNV